jgi:uncharacterized protein YuzE
MDGMAMMRATVAFSFDPEADAAYVYLNENRQRGDVARTRFCNIELNDAAINVDFDENGRIVGFEILGARKLLPRNLLGDVER